MFYTDTESTARPQRAMSTVCRRPLLFQYHAIVQPALDPAQSTDDHFKYDSTPVTHVRSACLKRAIFGFISESLH